LTQSASPYPGLVNARFFILEYPTYEFESKLFVRENIVDKTILPIYINAGQKSNIMISEEFTAPMHNCV